MRVALLPHFYSPALRIFSPLFQRLSFNNMATDTPHQSVSESPITAAEKPRNSSKYITRTPARGEMVAFAFSDGWDKCWEEGLTPWDLGSPTPVLVHLHNSGSLPKGRALVPGCGSGRDVVAIACPERHVVGLDVSDNAIRKAIELSSGSPKAEYFSFLRTDFFTWCPDQLFDLILTIQLRSMWARKMADILKPDGELVTLMFPMDDHEGGPPYKVSVANYEDALHPLGFKATHISDNVLAIPPRKGREALGRWKRSVCKSLL